MAPPKNLAWWEVQGGQSAAFEFEPAACFDIWLAAFHIIVQLYDSPFPTEPQNDLGPEKTERNAEIRACYEVGESVGELVANFDISEQRISQIIRFSRVRVGEERYDILRVTA